MTNYGSSVGRNICSSVLRQKLLCMHVTIVENRVHEYSLATKALKNMTTYALIPTWFLVVCIRIKVWFHFIGHGMPGAELYTVVGGFPVQSPSLKMR